MIDSQRTAHFHRRLYFVRRFDNPGHVLTRGAARDELGPNLVDLFAHIAQSDGSLESYRRNGAGDVTNLLAAAEEFVTSCREVGHWPDEAQSSQFTIHMAHSVQSIEHLLADVATFGVAYCPRFNAALLR